MVRHMQTEEHRIQLQRHNNPAMTSLRDVLSVEVEGEWKGRINIICISFVRRQQLRHWIINRTLVSSRRWRHFICSRWGTSCWPEWIRCRKQKGSWRTEGSLTICAV